MISQLIAYFKQSSSQTHQKTPYGFCPNCWGEQEYDHMIRTMYKDKQIDVNNHQAHYAFVQDFVVTYINGIHLKKGNNGWECPTCNKVYSEDPANWIGHS